MLTEKELQNLKEQLEKEAAELEVQLSSASKKPEFGSDVESDFSEEADEAAEFAKDLGVQDTVKGRLNDVEHALDKITRNQYGKCEKCGMDISMDVLKVAPESRLCKSCKAANK